jgi:hypothetical protein
MTLVSSPGGAASTSHSSGKQGSVRGRSTSPVRGPAVSRLPHQSHGNGGRVFVGSTRLSKRFRRCRGRLGGLQNLSQPVEMDGAQ